MGQCLVWWELMMSRKESIAVFIPIPTRLTEIIRNSMCVVRAAPFCLQCSHICSYRKLKKHELIKSIHFAMRRQLALQHKSLRTNGQRKVRHTPSQDSNGVVIDFSKAMPCRQHHFESGLARSVLSTHLHLPTISPSSLSHAAISLT